MPNIRMHAGYNEEEAGFIRYHLVRHNKEKVAYTEEEKMSFVLKNEEENIVGGLVGHTDWGCFFVDLLWVDDSLRGLGKGQELLETAETYARENGCRLIRLETFSFQAPNFYKKLGFKVMGELKDFPKGFTHYYMYKDL